MLVLQNTILILDPRTVEKFFLFAGKGTKIARFISFNSLYDRNSFVRKMSCIAFLFRKRGKQNKGRVFNNETYLFAYK